MWFIKAPPGRVTRYLWVGGVRGMSVRQLAEIFAPYGSPTVVLPEPTPPPDAPSASASPSPSPALPTQGPLQPSPADAPSPSPAASSGVPQPSSSVSPPNPLQPISCHHAFLAFEAEGDAAAAAAAVPRNGPWVAAGGRKLVVNFADVRRDKRPIPRPVALSAPEAGVPGLLLLPDFITRQQEQQLMAAIDRERQEAAEREAAQAAREEAEREQEAQQQQEAGEAGAGGSGSGGSGREGAAAAAGGCGGGGGGWEAMAKRRVQHYGFRFDYATRNVDPRQPLGPLPGWLGELVGRMEGIPEVCQPLDQLTVNEYLRGVGLSPHVDTHSAFTGPILSLSLGSHTVMEFRRGEAVRPLLLPPRSLLVMGGEARYAWQHYIPHRVADVVGGQLLPRSRRLSLTFRKVRGYPCDCPYPDCCDSQQAVLPPTRISLLRPTPSSSASASSLASSSAPSSSTAATAPAAATTTNDTSDLPTPQQHQQQQPHLLPHQRPPPPQQQQARELVDKAATAATARAAADGCDACCGEGTAGGAQERGGGGRGGDGGEDEESRLAALEAEYVHKVYDAIAPHFSATRFAIWPRVRSFIESLPPGGVVADVGCGNGKYFGVRRDLAVLGSDISSGLAAVAAQRLHPPGLPPSAAPPAADALIADALRLPYRPGSCDAVLCIAVLHHLSSAVRRVRLLRQLLRVLRPGGGRALVTVWATEQEDPAKTLAKWTRIAAPGGVDG
ncbi:hypothetical protein Agub_g2480, partial [Astrephomene gubernaculifera]